MQTQVAIATHIYPRWARMPFGPYYLAWPVDVATSLGSKVEVLSTDYTIPPMAKGYGGEPEKGEERHDGVHVRRFPLRRQRRFFSPGQLRSLLTVKADLILVHSYGYWYSEAAALAASARNIPFVFTPYFHPSSGRARRLYDRTAGRLTFNRASTVHLFLRETQRQLVEIGARADRLVVLPLPLNPATHKVLAGIRRSTRARGPDVVLGVGGLLGRKGWAHAVSMLATLSRTHPATKLRLAGYTSTGEPEHSEELRKLAATLGVGDRLEIVADPTPQELFACYADACVFTFPSQVESFGLVLLEAMAAGLPVVANATMGAGEIVPDGEVGTLVDVRHHDQYAAAVAGLLDDRALASAYGNTGRSVVNERFSVEALSPRLADLYRPALTG